MTREKQEAIKRLKKKIAERRKAWREEEKKWKDFRPPRYDNVYFEGLEWLYEIMGGDS